MSKAEGVHPSPGRALGATWAREAPGGLYTSPDLGLLLLPWQVPAIPPPPLLTHMLLLLEAGWCHQVGLQTAWESGQRSCGRRGRGGSPSLHFAASGTECRKTKALFRGTHWPGPSTTLMAISGLQLV